MSEGSIFKTFTMDREKHDWAEELMALTPVEKRGKLMFKREDYFAPLGYGGINGAKLRQLIHLLDREEKDGNHARGLITGASVMSPQIPMGAAVARHFGLPATVIIGATHPTAAMRNPMVRMGTWFGADFDLKVKVAFNPILQKRVRDLKEASPYDEHFILEYGITRDHKIHDPELVLAFHEVGGEQVRNIPDEAVRMVVPAGSCNSATSILHGIAKFRPKNLKDIYLIGIGPSKLKLIAERLQIFQDLTGIDHTIYEPMNFDEDFPVLYQRQSQPFFMEQETEERPYRLHFIDLHGTGKVKYHDRVPWEYEGITFHPTYEGKVMRWLFTEGEELVQDDTLFWIVGSEPKLENMAHIQGELGPFPDEIVLAGT